MYSKQFFKFPSGIHLSTMSFISNPGIKLINLIMIDDKKEKQNKSLKWGSSLRIIPRIFFSLFISCAPLE